MSRPLQRPLSDSELSYFLPSRGTSDHAEAGVNDMYLHIGLQAPPNLMHIDRLTLAWAILRIRHPLLASQVVCSEGSYDDVFFSFTPPSSVEDALRNAREAIVVKGGSTAEQLLDHYLNGPRTLSNDRLSALIIARSEPVISETSHVLDSANFEIMLCATHFIGDGHALHSTAAELFTLLGARGDPKDSSAPFLDLYSILETEWSAAYGLSVERSPGWLPESTEARLPVATCRLQDVAARVDFQCNESRLTGSHVFPKLSSPTRRTLVKTVPFDEARTKAILKKCKSEGVTVSNAMFALCNIAWCRAGLENAQSTFTSNLPIPTLMHSSLPSVRTRITIAVNAFLVVLAATLGINHMRPSSAKASDSRISSFTTEKAVDLDPRHSPMMMYTALNLRSYLRPTTSSSVWFLSVGYFNIILPAFISSSPSATFWHRARSAKAQCERYVKSGMLIGRTREMARERGLRAKKLAKLDDEVAAARRRETKHQVATDLEKTSIKSMDKTPAPLYSSEALLPRRVSGERATALVGLSLLGNLDAVYKHGSYPDIVLRTLNTGSRQRRGGMLMFGYTFAGKLWLSLGWDSLGFQPNVVETFWRLVIAGVDEFLLEN